MAKRKEFSTLKWIIFPANSIILAGIIAWFNLTVFGFRDGLPYSIIVAMIGVFSIIINKFTESENRSLARAAFVFEIFLTAALVINAAFSISVQREMSVARMAEKSQAQTIEQIGKLKGAKTQREALQKVDKQTSSQSVFGQNERILFAIMVGELALYAIAAFSLFAIAKLIEQKEPEPEFVWPQDLDVMNSTRATRRENLLAPVVKEAEKVSQDLTQKKVSAKSHETFDSAGLPILRETLKQISFYHPGISFKAETKLDHVYIRMVRANQGTQEVMSSTKAELSILNDAVRMSADAFRARLERFLRQNEFEI